MGSRPDQRLLMLGEELLTSARLIGRGLAEVQRLPGNKDFHAATMLMLSQGFERLMKSILCYRTLEVTGDFPTYAQIKGYGHALDRLLDEVVSGCFDHDYVSSRQVTTDDYAYLNSTELRSTMQALSRYATSSRYYYLNYVGGVESEMGSPHDEWDGLEGAILSDRPELLLQLADPGAAIPVFDELSRVMVVRFEKAARALSRLFVFGPLGDTGRQWSSYVQAFYRLSDDDLGTRDYLTSGV